MLATSNIDGVYHVFNVEPITVNNDDDKERLRFTAYELVEKNRDMIHEFDQRIKETNEDIARVKLELYSFDSFCERGTYQIHYHHIIINNNNIIKERVYCAI